MIENFQRWKANLSSWVDSAIDEICKCWCPDYSYKASKQNIENLEVLKILDNTDHLAKNASLKLVEYFFNFVIVAVFIGLFLYIDKVIRPKFGIFYSLLSLFLLIVLILFAYNFLILFISYLFKVFYHGHLKKRLKMRRVFAFLSFVKKLRIRLLILMIVTAYIINFLIISMTQNESNSKMIESFINNPFIEYNLNCIFLGAVWQFWLIFIVASSASCFSLLFVLKSQNIFELEDMESENRLIVGFLAIATFIIGVDIYKVRPIGIFLLILIIQTSSFEYYHSYLISKKRKKAQEIFQEQLLLEKTRYEELKRCYYHGGEKYKEKLLSTEKFLQLIKKREVYNINYKRRGLRSRRRK